MKPLLLAFGVAALWLVVASPVAHLDHHLLTAHMAQHLVLMLVVAPLILLGAPSLLRSSRKTGALGSAPPQGLASSFTVWRLASAPFALLSRWRPHLAFCWLAGTLTVIIWHIPDVFELALRSHFWHNFEQASFLLAGVLFWWPVVRLTQRTVSSSWSVPLYLFFATLPCDALSAFLTFCGHVVYPHYLMGVENFRLTPLEDQELAGALMWVTVTFAYLLPALVVTTQLLSRERERNAQVGVC